MAKHSCLLNREVWDIAIRHERLNQAVQHYEARIHAERCADLRSTIARLSEEEERR